MKKNVLGMIVTLCWFLWSGSLFAQDIIVLHSGDEIEAVVQEVSKSEVWYKKYSFQDGPVYSLPVSDIFMIKYPNGEKDMFTKQKPVSSLWVAKKEPGLALLCSLLLPGGGQYYNGQYRKGATMTMVYAASMIIAFASMEETRDYYGNFEYDMSEASAVFVTAAFGAYLWSVIDAPISANAINRRNGWLSWNLGKNARMSLRPDVNCQTYNMGGYRSTDTSYGAKLSLSFH